ncbi:hypothetical protein ACIRPR_33440 [Streptomyces griseoflavus]|uniref:hypothetical protein n=1 Tax=Streptomyces griseoflavus TaxID=35619 RepID=UPI0037F45027
MIPANGDFFAHFKTADGGWPVEGRRVIAWDDEGRPLVLGDKGLVLAESLNGFIFEGVREAPRRIEPLPGPHSYFGDEGGEDEPGLPAMQDQTITALRNYDWLIRNTRDGLTEVGLYFESDTVTVRDGGYAIQVLCEEGFTPATRSEQPQEIEAVTLPANSRFRTTR